MSSAATGQRSALPRGERCECGSCTIVNGVRIPYVGVYNPRHHYRRGDRDRLGTLE